MTKCQSLYFCLSDPPVFNEVAMFDRKVISSHQFDYSLLKIFFINLLAVIYDKKFLTRIRISMWCLICITSSKKFNLNVIGKSLLNVLSRRVSHFKTRRVNTSKLGQLTCFTSLEDRLPVISAFNHFGPGDFGRLSVISDGDFGRCAVKSDGDFGRCAVNSDAQLSSLFYHSFGTNIANFG